MNDNNVRRLNRSIVIMIAVVFSACSAQCAESADDARKPNMIVIVADDMGFSDAGCYGGEIATPNLDRLAANGLRYSQFYSTARCWPSRSCLMTGYYAQQVGADPPQGRLPAWAKVLPQYLKQAGYRSYHSGKWHVPGAPKPVADGGFDHSYFTDGWDQHFSSDKSELDGRPLPKQEDFYSATAVADYAVRFLKEHAEEEAEKPFFVYMAFIVPHFPLHALEEDIDRYRDKYLEGWDVMRQRRYERLREMGIVDCELSKLDPDFVPSWNLPEAELQERIGPGEVGRAVAWDTLTDEQKRFQATKMAIHAAMVDRMDREIGRVLDQVDAMGQSDDTVVFFVSDNGASAEQIIRGNGHDPAAPPGSGKTYLGLGPGFSTACNTPFRLHKHWNHEGGISSPLIVCWPKGIKDRGGLRHAPGHFVDVVPTLLELAGVPAPDDSRGKDAPPLAGRSLVSTFNEDVPLPRDYLFFHHQGNRAIRVGDWKLVSAHGPPTNDAWELYNLKTDRAEMNNLASAMPEKVKELADLWQKTEDEFRRQAGPPDPSSKAAKKAKKSRAGKKNRSP
jgi:arylsulfatase